MCDLKQVLNDTMQGGLKQKIRQKKGVQQEPLFFKILPILTVVDIHSDFKAKT